MRFLLLKNYFGYMFFFFIVDIVKIFVLLFNFKNVKYVKFD